MVGVSAMPTWKIIITEWALQSYVDLKYQGVFTDQEYWDTLRPDVELLRNSKIPSSGARRSWVRKSCLVGTR